MNPSPLQICQLSKNAPVATQGVALGWHWWPFGPALIACRRAIAFVVIMVFTINGMMDRAWAQNPRTLEEALVTYNWTWVVLAPHPDPWTERRFSKDGTATAWRRDEMMCSGTWKVTGPRTVTIQNISTQKNVHILTFDPAFRTFEGTDSKGKNRYNGARIESASSPSVASTTKPLPAPIVTDPAKPRVEVLQDQAPNAIEWALAPLEQAVPGDIRQNLTFLREDLLTETQDKPKLSATREAGARLCDAIIGVLDERKLTLAKAGFRAVEASARTGVTSQALEARRNYKMSWPQFAREESQRAELKSQAIGNAQVIAERPKLDWAQRTAALQKPLDDLYRQYCQALRQSAK